MKMMQGIEYFTYLYVTNSKVENEFFYSRLGSVACKSYVKNKFDVFKHWAAMTH